MPKAGPHRGPAFGLNMPPEVRSMPIRCFATGRLSTGCLVAGLLAPAVLATAQAQQPLDPIEVTSPRIDLPWSQTPAAIGAVSARDLRGATQLVSTSVHGMH